MLYNQYIVLGAISAVFFIIYIAHILRKRARSQDETLFAAKCAAETVAWQNQEKRRAHTYWNFTLRENIRDSARIGLTSIRLELESGVFCETLRDLLLSNGFSVYTYKKSSTGGDSGSVLYFDISWMGAPTEPPQPPQRLH